MCGDHYGFGWNEIYYWLTVSRESFELASEMGARISFMNADVATPPTSEWQALASSFASDSSTLISRLLLLFIFITIAACGLHLHMRKPLSGSDDGILLNAKPVPWERSKLASVCNWANLESDLIFCQLFNVDDTCVRILVLCIDTRCNWLCLNNLCLLMGRNCRHHRRRAIGRCWDERFSFSWRTFFFHWCCCGVYFVRSKYRVTGCGFHCHECFQLNHLRWLIIFEISVLSLIGGLLFWCCKEECLFPHVYGILGERMG